MAKLPTNNSLNYLLNTKEVIGKHRGHAGLSMIGSNCLRYLQYSHYWAYDNNYTVRIQRLFNVGHNAEPIMVKDMESVGYTFDSDQLQVSGFGGHWKGHIDGKFYKDGEEWLAEFKTHNDKYFKDTVNKGVQVAMPKHYSQVTSYMGYLGLKQALYMGYNKNTSEYYFEEIPFDESHFKDLQAKEAEVLMSDILLPRIGSGKPTWFECKLCSAKDVCFKNVKVNRNCRTCNHVDILEEGVWECSLHKKRLSVSDQIINCEDYTLAIMFKEV